MPWTKGQSGNPAGGPKDKLFADAVRVAVNREGPDGRKKLFALADKLVAEALNGESWAMQQVADRLDGKPAQESTVTINRPPRELSDHELTDIAAGSSEGADMAPLDPSQLN